MTDDAPRTEEEKKAAIDMLADGLHMIVDMAIDREAPAWLDRNELRREILRKLVRAWLPQLGSLAPSTSGVADEYVQALAIAIARGGR